MATTQQTKAGLMATYHLTQATLDRPVEDKDIPQLERIILDWGTIAMQLLERVDRKNVEEDGRKAAQKKRLMLETWQDRKGNAATFDRLITAMIDAGEVGQATAVCKLLNPGAGPASDAPQRPRLDDTPELNELGNLTKRDGTTFSVIEEIGRDYIKFGTQLLEDKRGTTMDSITDDFRGASNIKREVFKRWLRGTGMKPKTWKTLVNLLDSDALKLGTLASDIRDALQ